jgi:ubiquinone/menaquinone biosynthesis C-methylase UbiE
MTESLQKRIQHYVLDGSDRDLARLLTIAEVQAESARSAIVRLGDVTGWNVVECGCGPLGSLAVLSDLVGPAGRVVGIDFSAATVERARSVLATLGVDNVEVVLADLNALDPSVFGTHFDLAYTRAFLMHQVDQRTTLREIAQLLGPGSWLIAQEPLREPPPTSHPPIRALARYWELMHEAAARSGVSGDAIENLIESANDAGFELVNKGGFFNVTDPSVGFTIHAGAVSALRDRLTETGVTTGREIDDMEATLEEAASRDSGWVSTPFMLDLALRRTEAPVVP